MPLYDYRCEDCAHTFEADRPISRRDDAECPQCGARKVKRLVRGVGVLGGLGATRSAGCAPRRASGFG